MHAKATEAFRTYRRQLHRFLMRRLRRPQYVDDLAQEVYERLLRIADEKAVEKPLAYLYGVARHVLADYRIAEEDERACWDHDELDDEALYDCPRCILPDDLGDRLNLQQQIDHAIAQLPATHAAVLLAHKRDGYSYTETAEKLGLSEFTVEKYLVQAKSRLRIISWDR